MSVEMLDERVTPATDLTAASTQMRQAYGQTPISFEANVGQTASQVQYFAHGGGYALYLTADSAVLSLTQSTGDPTAGESSSTGVALAMNLVGANSQAQVIGQDQLQGTSNYFVGNDPSQWHTNIANFGQVAYQDVYPGVNLVYYGNQQQLEYDFDVAPGADPSAIRFAVQGADSLSLDAQGNLVLHTAGGDVLENAPVLYQTVGGVKQPVTGQFVLLGQDQVGFQVGAYDPSLPLTIDPVLSYGTYLGGSSNEDGYGIAVDGSGSTYIVGYTQSSDFPTTAGAFKTSTNGFPDVFVAKLNPSGTALLYSTYLGGSSDDRGMAIAVDGSGDAYVTGGTQSFNFPVTAGAFQTTYGGGQDAFVAKLNPTGAALLYSTFLGGNSGDEDFGIALDGAGDAYVVGTTGSLNFPATAGAFQTTFGGSQDAFVAKLNPTGTSLVYGTYLGGSSLESGDAIAVDAAGDAYVTGETTSANFRTTAGAPFGTYSGTQDAFVVKLNPSGTALAYSTYLGGSSTDEGRAIALDASGDAFVTGYTFSNDFPVTAGAFQTSHGSGLGTSAFIAELNATGTAFVYSSYLGDKNGSGTGIAVDGFGDAYVTGGTASTSFPITAGALQTTLSGSGDAFLVKLNPSGTALVYGTYFGGSGGEEGNGIALDGAGNAYLVGETSSSNLQVTAGALRTTYGGGVDDAFVAKFELATPTISNFSPTAAVFGGPGFTLTINGSNFDPAATVLWNATPLTVTSRTGSTQIQATVPASLLAGVASVSVTVTNPGPISSAAAPFTINPAGSATTVILGAEFVSGSVTYDGHVHGATASWASTGTDGAGGSLTVTYVGIYGTAYGPTTAAPTNSGQYEASATFAGDTNHTGSSNTADFTINRVSATSTETFVVPSVALQPSANLALDNDFTRFADAFADIRAGDTVEIDGTLDWSEPNALASWKATGEAFAMPHLNGITVEAANPLDGIQGPGDDPTISGEGPFYFDGLGADKSWNITGLTISDFDTAIFYSPTTDVTSYSGTHITDNLIFVPNAATTTSPVGGILLGPSPNQTIQGNEINIVANGGASTSSFGISSFTSGGNDWDGLLIDNNIVTVSTPGANGKVLGIGENSGSVGSNITVSNNQFNGDSGSLAGNQQVAFGITSESTATATVAYTGNAVLGAEDGFVWGDPEGATPYDFSGTQFTGITFSDTTLFKVGIGFVARDGGKATIGTTTIMNTDRSFNYGTAFSADGNGTVITVTDPVSNYTSVQNLSSQTNGGVVNFLSDAGGIGNVSKNEGNTGFTLFSFPVTLSAPLGSDQMFTVAFATSNGTADGNEYLGTQGILTFLPGTQSETIAVRVIGNFIPQPDLTFFVNLSNPLLYTNGVAAPGNLASTQATGTVLNDDTTTLTASIANSSVTKPTSGSTLMTFAATLNSAPTAGDYVTVNYTTSNAGSGVGFAGGNDYLGSAGTLTFLAGSTTPANPLTVTVFGNTQVNPNEIFNVTLSTPLLHFSGVTQTIPANLGTATATGTIMSPAPTGASVSINSPSIVPSASGSTVLSFTITLTGTITNPIKVYYGTASAGSGAGDATGNQYQATSGVVTFTPTGSNTATESVMIFQESTPLPVDEIFDVKLTNPLGQPYTFGTAIGVGTIDD